MGSVIISSVYLIITDLHLNTTKENRFSYNSECISIINKISEIVMKYRNIGYDKVYGILLGDLVDGSSRDRFKYTRIQQQIKLLISNFDSTFLNFGNHEITFYKNNPLYSFLKKIDNFSVKSSYYQLTCESFINEIETPERIILNNAEILFRGYGTYNDFTENKEHNILLLHENLLSNLSLLKCKQLINYDFEPFDLITKDIEHVYCGHLHTVIEDWNIGECQIHNLGSLLRTSHLEVSDYDAKRNIPALLVDSNNNYVGTEDNLFTLHKRTDIIDEGSLKVKQLKTEEKSKEEYFKTISEFPSLVMKDPLEISRELINDQPDKLLLERFDMILKGMVPNWKGVVEDE